MTTWILVTDTSLPYIAIIQQNARADAVISKEHCAADTWIRWSPEPDHRCKLPNHVNLAGAALPQRPGPGLEP
jgi:hypothetical protein